MAENRPESRVFLSVKIVDNQFVVSNGDDIGNTVPVYIFGTETETDEPSQQAAHGAQGEGLVSYCLKKKTYYGLH